MNGTDHQLPRRDRLMVLCGGCGYCWQLGDRDKLATAKARGQPIFPARCRHCGKPFSKTSLDALREIALTPLAHPAGHAIWHAMIPLVPK